MRTGFQRTERRSAFAIEAVGDGLLGLSALSVCAFVRFAFNTEIYAFLLFLFSMGASCTPVGLVMLAAIRFDRSVRWASLAGALLLPALFAYYSAVLRTVSGPVHWMTALWPVVIAILLIRVGETSSCIPEVRPRRRTAAVSALVTAAPLFAFAYFDQVAASDAPARTVSALAACAALAGFSSYAATSLLRSAHNPAEPGDDDTARSS